MPVTSLVLAVATVTLSFTHRSKRHTPSWWVDMKVNVYIRGQYSNGKQTFGENREICITGPHMTALAEPTGAGKQTRCYAESAASSSFERQF